VNQVIRRGAYARPCGVRDHGEVRRERQNDKQPPGVVGPEIEDDRGRRRDRTFNVKENPWQAPCCQELHHASTSLFLVALGELAANQTPQACNPMAEQSCGRPRLSDQRR
jgi:hypothetical protein